MTSTTSSCSTSGCALPVRHHHKSQLPPPHSHHHLLLGQAVLVLLLMLSRSTSQDLLPRARTINTASSGLLPLAKALDPGPKRLNAGMVVVVSTTLIVVEVGVCLACL